MTAMTNERDTLMIHVKKVVGFLAFAVVVFLVLDWIAEGNQFFVYKIFAPR
jgi:hypothetical protein